MNEEMKLVSVKDVMGIGVTLKDYIKKNKLSENIQGKEYVMVDGWKFAGINLGLLAIPSKSLKNETDKIVRIGLVKVSYNGREYEKVGYTGFTDDELFEVWKKSQSKFSREIIAPFYSYECECEIINATTGLKVGFGDAICTNMEIKKATFDEYSIKSMAQTRSIGKAYRNLIGYVMNQIGYESTPAEEMEMETLKEEHDERMTINDSQFATILKKLKAGETTKERLITFYNFTPDQLEQLK